MKKIAAFLLTAVMVLGSSMSVLAADFTPSVTQKAAPNVKTVQAADGTEGVGIFKDKDGKEIAVLGKEYLLITPLAKRDSASADVKKLLDDAYDNIQKAAKASDLCSDLSDDMVVTDLFDVELGEGYGDYMKTEGNTLTLTFDANKTKGQKVAVMTRCDGKTWEMVDPKNVTVNADGTVTVTFAKFCPVAFLTDAASVSVDANGPASPQTSDMSGIPFGAALAVLGAAAVVCLAAAKKRNAGI